MPNFFQSKAKGNLEPIVNNSKRQSKRWLASKDLSQNRQLDQIILGNGPLVDVGIFLLKMAALEVVRRFSNAKCPFVWRGLQALQIFCYPPFKWIQRWYPFGSFVGCMQTLSRPMLALSIATTFSDSTYFEETPESSNVSDDHTETQPDLHATHESRITDEVPEKSVSQKWLLQLHEELDKLGLNLPERINDDELLRFYTAANGEFATLLSSIKKTIRWRESYTFLSLEELEIWSHLVFWHGHDVRLRPCLMIRLGLAFSELTSSNKAGFSQAVVSQVEHGVLQLAGAENPQITVLMDCENLSPFKFPMQMMRSIAVLLQDHYPNRLNCLFIIRLPSVARVIIQTLTQVLKPATRQKVRIIGENYHQILSEILQTLPYFLGGQCPCPKCSTMINIQDTNKETEECRQKSKSKNETRKAHTSSEVINDQGDISSPVSLDIDTSMNVSYDQVLRNAIVGILIIWIFIAFIVVLHDP